MSTEFWDASGNLFENVFEPANGSNGVSDPAYKDINGNPLVFCALGYGSQAEHTGYGRTGGAGDVNTLWAKKGSVSYLTTSPGWTGTEFGASESVTLGDTLYCDAFLHFYSNGTWTLTSVTTNYVTDDVPAYANAGIYDYSNGRTLASGNWAANPAAGIGSNYAINASVSGMQSGWKDYPVQPPLASNVVYYPGGFKGLGTIEINGSSGTGNGISLANTVTVGLTMKAAGNGGNGSYLDNNGGLSWYNQAVFTVQIYNVNNPSISVSATITLYNELRWQNSSYPNAIYAPAPSPTPSPSPSPTPSPGTLPGGCVTTDSFMFHGGRAGDVQVGHQMLVTNAWDLPLENTEIGEVLQSNPMYEPCVRIVTTSGASLKCSTSAPIPISNGTYVNAPHLKGAWVPVARRSAFSELLAEHIGLMSVPFQWEEVVEVEDLGFQPVQQLFVKHRCFWASEDGELFILHHNLKALNSGTAA